MTILVRRTLLFLALLGVWSCQSPVWTRPAVCPIPITMVANHVTTYVVHATKTTPEGTPYDDTGLVGINPARIDRILDEAAACLDKTFGGVLPPDVVAASMCKSSHYMLPDRGCVAVKIASDSHVAYVPYTSQQEELLSEKAPCDPAKPLPADGACYYRMALSGLSTIVVPPSEYLLKDGWIRIAVGCDNPWASPGLAACASPSALTKSLDDGTGP